MSRVVINLVDSKLQAAEARTEARVAHIETMVQANIQALNEFKKDTNEFKKLIHAEVQGLRKDMSNLKFQAVLFSLAMVATIILGVAAFNSAIVSNVIGSFEKGLGSADRVRTEFSAQTRSLAEEIAKLSDTINRLHLRDQHQTEPQEKRR